MRSLILASVLLVNVVVISLVFSSVATAGGCCGGGGSGDVTNVTGGDGLVDDGATGNITLDVDLKTGAEDAVGAATSVSGLEFESGQLTLLQGCDDTEGLVWVESTDTWDCGSVGGGGSGDVTDVIGGDGLADDGATGDITLDIDLKATPENGVGSTSSASGLEIVGGELTTLQGCDDTEGLVWVESTDTWDCGSVGGGGSGDVTDVIGGDGLADDGATGDITLDIDLKATPEDGVGSTSSASGLEIVGGELTMLQGCDDEEVQVWDESTDTWDCHATALQRTQEEIEDFAGALIADGTGTHSGVSVTYQDSTGDVDIEVDEVYDTVAAHYDGQWDTLATDSGECLTPASTTAPCNAGAVAETGLGIFSGAAARVLGVQCRFLRTAAASGGSFDVTVVEVDDAGAVLEVGSALTIDDTVGTYDIVSVSIDTATAETDGTLGLQFDNVTNNNTTDALDFSCWLSYAAAFP